VHFYDGYVHFTIRVWLDNNGCGLVWLVPKSPPFQFSRSIWREIRAVNSYPVGTLQYLLDKYNDIFTEELGTVKSNCT
jgi:hypothetical protein